MRHTLGMIISVSLLAAGCASLRQETMYQGPFGRTEVGGIVIAADPGASKILVETYDGDLWIYDVDPAIRGRLSSLRVGDEILLAFDDRIGGKRALALNVVASGTRVVPVGLSVAAMLPRGVTFGALATNPGGAVGVGGTSANLAFASSGTVVMGSNGVAVLSGPGVIVPGFVSFSSLPAGTLLPQTAVSLGLTPSTFIGGPSTFIGPTGATTLATTNGAVFPGREPITSGNFSPGTLAPGVTTANPSEPGQPFAQGPFTPGTVAPGVSQQQGNAPPPPAGATTGQTSTGVVMTPNANRPGSDTSATGAGVGAPPGTTGTPGMTVAPGSNGTGTTNPATTGTTGTTNTGNTGTTARPDNRGTTGTTPAPQPNAAPAGGAAARPPGGSQ
jgi:hypothetical protein